MEKFTNGNCTLNWEGEGWYAVIANGDGYEYDKVGEKNTPAPNVYGTGYGTPRYITSPDKW